MKKQSHFTISRLAVNAVIGCHAHERVTPQPLLLDLRFPVNTAQAARQDSLSDTLDYQRLCESLTTFVEASQFQLLESLGEALVELLANKFALQCFTLTLHKPEAIANAQCISLTLEQGLI